MNGLIATALPPNRLLGRSKIKLRPIGGFNSPNYHNIVLKNWGRDGNFLGNEGYAGKSLFVTSKPSCGFCIEERGHDLGLGDTEKYFFPFDPKSRSSRRLAWLNTVRTWRAL